MSVRRDLDVAGPGDDRVGQGRDERADGEDADGPPQPCLPCVVMTAVLLSLLVGAVAWVLLGLL